MIIESLDSNDVLPNSIDLYKLLYSSRLRKDMVARVNDLSSEFRRVSKRQVVQTTRQIILENVRLNNQMALIETDYNTVEVENGKIRAEVIF